MKFEYNVWYKVAKPESFIGVSDTENVQHIGSRTFKAHTIDCTGNIDRIILEDGEIMPAEHKPIRRSMFIEQELDFGQIVPAETTSTDEETDKDFWVITVPSDSCVRPMAMGPSTEAEANEFALSQKRNAADGVRILVVRQQSEAFVEAVLR